MTKRPDQTPLLADPTEPEYLRELLEAGRDFRVSDYDFDKGLSKHLGLVQAGAPIPDWAKSLEGAQTGTAGAAATGAAGASIAGWIALPVVTATLIAAVMYAGGGPEAAQHSARPVAVVSAPPSAPVAEPVAPALQPSVVASTPAAAGAQPKIARAHAMRAAPSVAAKGASAKEPVRVGQPTRAPAPAPAGVAAAQRSALPAQEELLLNARPAVSSERILTPQRVRAPVAQATEPEEAIARPEPQAPKAEHAEPVLDDARLEREMGMLAVTQRVLHSDPERALKLARQGEGEFTGSMFAQERQQLLLLSLIKLGRIDEARRLAKPYLARYPNGPFSDRVRRALATGRVER